MPPPKKMPPPPAESDDIRGVLAALGVGALAGLLMSSPKARAAFADVVSRPPPALPRSEWRQIASERAELVDATFLGTAPAGAAEEIARLEAKLEQPLRRSIRRRRKAPPPAPSPPPLDLSPVEPLPPPTVRRLPAAFRHLEIDPVCDRHQRIEQ